MEAIRKFFKKVNNESGDHCAYIICFQNQKPILEEEGPCHGKLQDLSTEQKKVTSIYSSLWPGELNKKDCDIYWRYILDKRHSPWRALLKGSRTYRPSKGSWYFRLSDMDVPGPLLANFLIATRLPIENKGSLVTFNKFIKAGFTRAESIYLAAYLKYDLGYLKNVKQNDHLAFTPDDHLSFRRIKAADPHVNSEVAAFGKGGPVLPINQIWHGYGAPILNIIKAREKYIGIFPRIFNTYYDGEHFKEEFHIPINRGIKRLKERKNDWAKA